MAYANFSIEPKQQTYFAIRETKGLSKEEIRFEVGRGGRFVRFRWCFSMIAVTYTDWSQAYLIKSGESRFSRHIWYSLATFLFGWWGFPSGPIQTVRVLITNFRGGLDVTQAALAQLDNPPKVPQPSGPRASSETKRTRLFLLAIVLVAFLTIILLLKK